MESKVKIPFADKDGKIVHISQVKNGLDCDCNCCKCGAQLIAKNNEKNIREAHFSHYNSPDCVKSLETSIHKAAQQLISQIKRIVVPDLWQYFNTKEIIFEKVELEKTLPYEFRADALGHINNTDKIIVEFAVTHFVDAPKIQKINKLKIPAIEVLLNRSCFSFNDIENILLGSAFKKWLYYPMQDIPEINSFIQRYESQINTLTTTIDTLKSDNHKLSNDKNELEKINSDLRIENVKLKRNLKGLKA